MRLRFQRRPLRPVRLCRDTYAVRQTGELLTLTAHSGPQILNAAHDRLPQPSMLDHCTDWVWLKPDSCHNTQQRRLHQRHPMSDSRLPTLVKKQRQQADRYVCLTQPQTADSVTNRAQIRGTGKLSGNRQPRDFTELRPPLLPSAGKLPGNTHRTMLLDWQRTGEPIIQDQAGCPQGTPLVARRYQNVTGTAVEVIMLPAIGEPRRIFVPTFQAVNLIPKLERFQAR